MNFNYLGQGIFHTGGQGLGSFTAVTLLSLYQELCSNIDKYSCEQNDALAYKIVINQTPTKKRQALYILGTMLEEVYLKYPEGSQSDTVKSLIVQIMSFYFEVSSDVEKYSAAKLLGLIDKSDALEINTMLVKSAYLYVGNSVEMGGDITELLDAANCIMNKSALLSFTDCRFIGKFINSILPNVIESLKTLIALFEAQACAEALFQYLSSLTTLDSIAMVAKIGEYLTCIYDRLAYINSSLSEADMWFYDLYSLLYDTFMNSLSNIGGIMTALLDLIYTASDMVIPNNLDLAEKIADILNMLKGVSFLYNLNLETYNAYENSKALDMSNSLVLMYASLENPIIADDMSSYVFDVIIDSNIDGIAEGMQLGAINMSKISNNLP